MNKTNKFFNQSQFMKMISIQKDIETLKEKINNYYSGYIFNQKSFTNSEDLKLIISKQSKIIDDILKTLDLIDIEKIYNECQFILEDTRRIH